MKKIKKTKKFNIKYVVILGLLIIGGFLLFSSLNQTARIARIDIAQPEICKSNIESFEAANICSSTGFSNYTYSCKNMPSVQIAKNSECMSYEMAYNKVSLECGQICNVVAQSPVATTMSSARPSTTPYPSPTPQASLIASAIPSPIASANPSLFSCKVRVFKLKSTDINTTNPGSFVTPDREVVPGSNKVSPGENYAYLIEGVANNFTATIATISASTNNISGFDEPILVKSTTPYCKPEGSVSKYLSCIHPEIQMIAGSPALFKMGMVVEIQKDISRLRNTSTNFHVNYLYNGSYYPADCAVTMLVAETVASPTPTIAPGCYVEKPFCLNSLIGGVCPSRMVCPSPTPTPTPTPSPLTPVVSCAKQLGSWTYREMCAKATSSYRYLDFNCQGETKSRTIGSANSCKNSKVLISEAKAACLNTACITPTPTPRPTLRPVPTPVSQRCYKILGRRYCWKNDR